MEISEEISKAFLNVMTSNSEGLWLVPVPTSAGKSTAVAMAIADFISQHQYEREDCRIKNIIYTVQRKSILDEVAFKTRRLLSERGLNYDDYCIEIPSNVDAVITAYKNGCFEQIPDKLKLEEDYRELVDDLKNIEFFKSTKEQIEKDGKTASGMYSAQIEKNEKKLPKLELNFRRQIRKYIKSDLSNRKIAEFEKNNTGEGDNPGNYEVTEEEYKDALYKGKYKWAVYIYPHALDENYKVQFMTSQKFIEGGVPLFPRKRYREDYYLAGKAVYLDEFDRDKNIFCESIVKSLKDVYPSKDHDGIFTDIRVLCEETITALLRMVKTCSTELLECRPKNQGSKNSYDSLIARARYIEKKYMLPHSMRYIGRGNTYFYFRAADWIELKDNNQIVLRPNKKENILKVIKKNKDFKKQKDDVEIREMVNEFNGFLRAFTRYISTWALKYAAKLNIEYEDAIDSILTTAKTHYSDNGRRILRKYFDLNPVRVKVYDSGRTANFYSTGSEIFQLRNMDAHTDNTSLLMTKISETAEKDIIRISRNTIVFALSATADSPSVTTNFDINYISEELGYYPVETGGETVYRESFHNILDDYPGLDANVKKFNELANCEYEKGELGFEPVDVLYNHNEDDLLSLYYCSENNIFGQGNEESRLGKEIDQIIANYMPSAVDERSFKNCKYYKNRYLNVAIMIFGFCGRIYHQSFLCLGSRTPRRGDQEFNLDCLELICEKINDYYTRKGLLKDIDKVTLQVLRGAKTDFRIDKKIIDDKFRNGERLFVISAYNSISIGNNLQYPCSERFLPYCVTIDSLKERDKTLRDYDEHGFLEYTNAVMNLNGPGTFEFKDLLKNIIEACEANEGNMINRRDRNNQLKSGFELYSNPLVKRKNKVRNSDEMGNIFVSQLIQSSGRFQRTPVRTKYTHIYIESRLLNSINTEYLRKKWNYISAELRLLCEKAEDLYKGENSYSYRQISESNILKTQKTSEKINAVINSCFNFEKERFEWNDPENIRYWNEERPKCMANPTVITLEDLKKDTFFRDSYLRSPDGVNADRYWYYCRRNRRGQNDYGDLIINWKSREDLEGHLLARKKKTGDKYDISNIHEVSEESSRVRAFDNYHPIRLDIRDFERRNKIRRPWGKGRGIMSPPVFEQFYKALVGELYAKFVIEDRLGIKTETIEELDKKESFDNFVLGHSDIAVDFKNWGYFPYLMNEQEKEELLDYEIDKIHRKMKAAGFNKVIILGTVTPDPNIYGKMTPWMKNDIMFIPGTVFENGNADTVSLEYLKNNIF